MPRRFDQSDLQHASLFRRLAALVYDLLVVIAILFFVSGIGVWINDGEAVDGPVYKSALFIAVFLFNGFFWTKSGMTIGMMAWRLRVQRIDGNSITWSQALKRFFAALLSIACLGLGYFWMLFSEQRMTWHDALSGTRVVLLPPRKKTKEQA